MDYRAGQTRCAVTGEQVWASRNYLPIVVESLWGLKIYLASSGRLQLVHVE